MRKIILSVFFLLIIAGCSRKDQNEVSRETHTIDTLATVEEINSYKDSVDSMKSSLDSLEKDIYKSAEGGSIKAFYTNSDTLKKEIIYYGETGKRILHLYLREGRKIFLRDVSFKYNAPINVDEDVEISDKVEDLYYLDNKLGLIYWVRNDEVMSDSLYKVQEKELIKEYDTM